MRFLSQPALAAVAVLLVSQVPSLSSALQGPQIPISSSNRRAAPKLTTLPTVTSTTTTAKQAIAVPFPDGGSSVTVPSQEQPRPSSSSSLAPQDAWISNLDYEGFGKEVTALGKELSRQGGTEDVAHLRKMVQWRNVCALVGLATVWMTPNPLTILALSTWTYSSWAMIAHHTCHGGYNRVNADGFNSRGFALGSMMQRAKDWLDWMDPESWNIEHNRLHHYRLNEASDPDLVQRNLDWLRDSKMSMMARYAVVAFFVPVWKWLYYAPNTYKELQVAKLKKEGKELPPNFNVNAPATVPSLLFYNDEESNALKQVVKPVEFFAKVAAPFFLSRFVVLPSLFLLVPGVGPNLFVNALINIFAAELLTNAHAFVTIVTNHAGEDLYTFDDAVKPKTPSFYVRQIIGSANYRTGTDPIDFVHGWLNYQIEHHVWPDLSMRQYQRAAPQLKAICEKYGVPYVQESVWTRLRKTIDIMVGKTTMRLFPTQYEPAKDKAVNGVTWKSTNGAIDEE